MPPFQWHGDFVQSTLHCGRGSQDWSERQRARTKERERL